MSWPNHWIETDLDTVVTRMTNGSGSKQVDSPFENSYPITRIETIAQGTIDLVRVKYTEADCDVIEKYGLLKGDILFSHINSDKHLGKTALFDLDDTVIHGINLLLIRTVEEYDSNFLNYLFRFYRLEGKFIEVAQRAVNQSSINQKKLKSFKVPLPPLAEQMRIVAKLDEVFRHLDTLKAKLERIPELLKNFRQAVLTQAVTGKLTEKWREEYIVEPTEELYSRIRARIKSSSKRTIVLSPNSKEASLEIPEEWLFVNLGELSEKLTYGTSSKSDNDGEVPVLRMGNLQQGKIDLTDLKYTSDPAEVKKYALRKGDVLFNRTNSPELVGKTSIYETDLPAIYAGYLIKVWNYPELNSYYLNYVLNSMYAKRWAQEVKSDGVSQSNINAQKLADFLIPLPSEEEQKEIIKRVEALFAKADAIEGYYATLKERTDKLPQALLAKAFRGELVPQDANDEPASLLLEKIKAAKATTAKPAKSRKAKGGKQAELAL